MLLVKPNDGDARYLHLCDELCVANVGKLGRADELYFVGKDCFNKPLSRPAAEGGTFPHERAER